ncbi:peptidyl-prolyl cis-trans isomerase [Corticibacter populi]|uniref:Peptidyl-prolyl cis-trans isomerase n=2 Tax=Corticibacter populi TaxID=1550736 RepID=A0A3M6QHT3_9BURK|nr:peptidylprolyl isomerase [Corticibacter populi]RMX02653.1 peptidyl-prolyl cis-trans isomerase [Corticibacter populi]
MIHAKRQTLRTLLLGACAALALHPVLAQNATPAPTSASANAAAAATADAPRVKLETSAGPIVLELNREKAPRTVENFLQYVQDKHYDGTIFHRVIDGFMIQGGGFTPELQQKPVRAPIVLEADNGLKNERGTIAMARTMVPNSATSQFFINVANNTPLDARPGNPGYAVFGKVVEGMDVVDQIKSVPTGNQGPHQNVPVQPILILSASTVE